MFNRAPRRPLPAIVWERFGCGLIVLAAGLVGCTSAQQRPGGRADQASFFIGLTNFAAFERATARDGMEVTLTSPKLNPPFAFDELIVSWNATAPAGSGLQIEARAEHSDGVTQFYTVGLWAADPPTVRARV